MPAKRVVVTGLGTTSPLGGDVASTWEAMLKGQSGVRHLTEDWVEQMPVKIAARVAVEPSEVLERVRARRLDRTSQFAVIAAEEAWKDSGLDGVEIDKDRLGVAIASGIGGVPVSATRGLIAATGRAATSITRTTAGPSWPSSGRRRARRPSQRHAPASRR